MKIASFNVENMFSRPVALNQTTWAEGKPTLEAVDRLNKRLAKATYAAADKAAILSDLKTLGLDRTDSGPMALLRQVRGKLIVRGNAGPRIEANGRSSWIGWVELRTEAVNELATRHTAQVIADVGADVLGVIEAENRTTLRRFADTVLTPTTTAAFQHVMCIDGNDERGIDVGLYTRTGFPITAIGTHIDDTDADGIVFSRDCAEYRVATPSGNELLVLVNHFKSKGYGTPAASNRKRERQAQRVADIYQAHRNNGTDLIAIVCDLNDTPASGPLAPLLTGTDLADIATAASFDDGGRPGTFGTAAASNKIDYVLLSPALFTTVQSGGIFRKGCFSASGRWPMYPTVTRAEQAASDHAAIWADVNI